MSAPGGGRFSSTIFARLFHRFGRYRNNLKLLMLGLDAAGKTTLLHKLKLEEARIETATVGFNLEAIRYRNVTLTMWDVGGQEKIRALWRHYFVKTQGLIFVVDSNDRDRIMEAKDELHNLLADSELREAKLLVFANKQDLGKPLDATMVTQFLELSKLQDREWHVQGCSASSGKGLYEGLDWLVSVLQPCSHLPQTM